MREPTDFKLWNRGGWPREEVMGEKYRAAAIRRLFPPALTSGQEVEGLAHLLPEPDNEHDPFAIRVEFDGVHLGYLKKERSAKYQPLFAKMVTAGRIPTADCTVYGYEYDSYDTDSRGRRLPGRTFVAEATVILDEPHLCVPVTQAPTQPHRVLPHGSALQLKGEELHLDVLAPLVGTAGEAWVHGVLSLPGEESGGKPIVTVSVNGSVIGELTPTTSAHFVPVIDHLRARGMLAVAKVFLKGNALKVEAVLHASKSHELDASWLSEDLPAPTELGADAKTLRVPPKPRVVFVAPPGWPPVPEGFEPNAQWRPLPQWPTPPADWQYWRLAE